MLGRSGSGKNIKEKSRKHWVTETMKEKVATFIKILLDDDGCCILQHASH